MGQGHSNIQTRTKFDKAADRQLEKRHNLFVQDMKKFEIEEYDKEMAFMIGPIIYGINTGVKSNPMPYVEAFAQQYILQKGLKEFGERGKDASMKELKQLHKRKERVSHQLTQVY